MNSTPPGLRGIKVGATKVSKPGGFVTFSDSSGRLGLTANPATGVVDVVPNTGPNGLAPLDGAGKIPSGYIPSIGIVDTFVVGSQAAMLALAADHGDVAIRTDQSKSYILMGTDPTNLADWVWLPSPPDAVLSVNGYTGSVVLTAFDIGYTPTTPANWTSVPTTDGGALDYIATKIHSGAPNQPTYYDLNGDLAVLPNVSVDTRYGSYGFQSYANVSHPVDAGDIYFGQQRYEVEFIPVQTTVQFHPTAFVVDAHHDRTATGFNTNDVTGMSVNMHHEGTGTVGFVAGFNLSTFASQGPATAMRGLYSSVGLGAGASSGFIEGIRSEVNLDVASTTTNATNLTLLQNGPIVGAYRAIESSMGGTIGGDATSWIDSINGNIGGNATNINLGQNGTITGNSTAISGYINFVSANSATAIAMSFGNGAVTGSKIGINMTLGDGAADSATLFNGYAGLTTTTNQLFGVNVSLSNASPNDEFGFNVALSNSVGKNSSYGLNIQMAGTQNNLTPISIGGTATATNVTGLQLQLSGVTSSKKKIGIQLDGGALNASYDWGSDVSLDPAQIITHNLQSNFTVKAGHPITAAGPFTPQFGFGVSLSGNFAFEDDYNADFTGARLGYSMAGMLGGLAGTAGKTVDMFSLLFAGAAVQAGTGGTITDANGVRVMGILPNAGTPPTITNMAAVHVDSVFDVSLGSNRWGFKNSSDTDNWFKKNLIVGGSSAQALNSSVGIQIDGTDKALLLSRLTTLQISALTAVDGMLAYDSNTNRVKARMGGTWYTLQTTATGVDSVTGTSPIIIDNTDPTNPIVTIQAADATHDGYLAQADWVRFDAIANAGITALTGEVTAAGPGSVAATVSNAAVIGKVLTGFASGAGTVTAADSILTAIQKLDGNVAGAVLLAGRSGGQTINGGTAASENLTLSSTAHATKGLILFSDTLAPTTDATYSGGWQGTDIGDATHNVRDVYSKGEFHGFRFENFTSGTLPSASATKAGRAVFATDNGKVYVDTGGSWVAVGGSNKYLSDTAWNGSQTQQTFTVSASITDARNAIWAIHDNANNFERIFAKIEAISATQVRVTMVPAPAAGSYRLIGIE